MRPHQGRKMLDPARQKPNTLDPDLIRQTLPEWGHETKGTIVYDRQDSHCPVSRTWALVMRDLPGVGKTISSETQETRLQEVH